jgi:hypothetical protein
MTQFQLGSISTGTLRTEDLLPAFIDAITALGGTLPNDLECVKHMEYTNLPSYASVAVIDDAADFWVSDDAGYDMQALENTLQELCPPFVYFGNLEGDGADFGFWVDMDRLNEELQWERDHYPDDSVPDELTLDDDGVIVHVNDHGNVTVMDMERNVLWSVV